jgi:Amt family ammonium transporter
LSSAPTQVSPPIVWQPNNELGINCFAPPAVDDLNLPFNAGDQAYIIVSSAMVLLMVPGIAFLYSGLARRKSALSLIWVTMMSFSVVVFQWYFWGYSLALSSTATNGFIGNLDKFGLRNTLGEPSPGSPLIPELLYSFYQVRLRTKYRGGGESRGMDNGWNSGLIWRWDFL